MTVDKIEIVPELNIFKPLKKIFHFFSLTGWAILCIVLICLFIAFFIAYYLEPKAAKKRLFFILGFFSFCLTIGFFLIARQKGEMKKNIKYAVIFSQESAIRLEPELKSESIFFLHEGAKVMLIDSSNAYWTKIKLQDGRVGWISNDSFKPI
jgi:hypothetical protein